MATFPFLSSAQGDPVNFQARIAGQPVAGVAATTGFSDVWSNGGPLTPTRGTVERRAIKPGGDRQAPLQGWWTTGNGPWDFGDVDPASKGLLQVLLSALDRFKTTNVSGAHYRHLLGPSFVSAPASTLLTLLRDPDTGLRPRYRDCRTSGVTISVQQGQPLAITANIATGSFDYWGDPVQTAGSGSTPPQMRGTFDGNLAADAVDKDLYIKTQTAASKTVQPKVSAAAAYSAAQALVAGSWNYLTKEDGSILGTRADQPAIYIPTGATLADDDVWKFPRRRARWVPSYPTARPIGGTQTRLMLDGDEVFMDGGYTIAINLPGVASLSSPGGAHYVGTIRAGQRTVAIQCTRRMIDLRLQQALFSGASMGLIVDARNDTLIGATATPYSFRVICPKVIPTGPFFDVAPGGADQNEQVTLEAYEADSALSYEGESFTAAVSVLVDTDVAAITW